MIKLACTICWRLSYEPLSEGDQFWNALKQLLPLAAFSILFSYLFIYFYFYNAIVRIANLSSHGDSFLSSRFVSVAVFGVPFPLEYDFRHHSHSPHLCDPKGRKKGAAIRSAEDDNAVDKEVAISLTCMSYIQEAPLTITLEMMKLNRMMLIGNQFCYPEK